MLRPHLGRLLAAVAFDLMKDSPLWLIPVFTAKIINLVVAKADVGTLWLYVGISVLVLAQNIPNHLLYVRMFSAVYRSVAADLRNALAAHLQDLSLGYHNRKSASILQNKVVRDVESVELLMQQVFPTVAVSISILVGSLVVTAIQAPAFLIVFALTVPIAAVLVSRMRAGSARRNEDFRMRMEGLSAAVGEMALMIPLTRAHGLEETARQRVESTAGEVRQAGLALDRLNGRFETFSWVSFNVLSVVCLGLAGWAAISGILPISAGQVVLLSTYFATLTGSVSSLLSLTPIVSRGIESLKSIGEVLEESDLERNEGKRLVDTVTGAIVLDDVSFAFAPEDVPTISHVSLEIRPGETVAFVGPSGSGKSTTINLILGFIRPSSGRILIDGADAGELDLRRVRQFVSVVPQESTLFDGTILENITYGLPHIDEARVTQAIIDANAAEIIEELPDGWNTVVGQRGARLSGGQRQRLAIARALVRDPRILLLDEATSALDSESESKVQGALAHLMTGRTSLVVAHRLSTIRTADRIVVMERGRVVESGTHEELVRLDARYARLLNAQNL